MLSAISVMPFMRRFQGPPRAKALNHKPTPHVNSLPSELIDGKVAGVSQAAEVLGYSVRTVQRWWQCYREGGLAALLAPPQRRGAKERLSPEAWEGLQAEMRAGHIGGVHEAQLYLRDTWHIAYGIDAISKLFRRRKTK